MDNTMFRANMENAVNAANVKCSMPTQEPIHRGHHYRRRIANRHSGECKIDSRLSQYM